MGASSCRRDPRSSHLGQKMLLQVIKDWWTNFPNQVRVWGSIFVSKYKHLSKSDNVGKKMARYFRIQEPSLHLVNATICHKSSSSSTIWHTRHRRRSRGTLGVWLRPRSISNVCELQRSLVIAVRYLKSLIDFKWCSMKKWTTVKPLI